MKKRELQILIRCTPVTKKANVKKEKKKRKKEREHISQQCERCINFIHTFSFLHTVFYYFQLAFIPYNKYNLGVLHQGQSYYIKKSAF